MTNVRGSEQRRWLLEDTVPCLWRSEKPGDWKGDRKRAGLEARSVGLVAREGTIGDRQGRCA